MRKDMARVIVERPRLGGSAARKGRSVALEDLPQEQGMRRPHRDVASGTMIPVGPPVDDPALWREYRRKHLDRRYAVAKRQISGKELRKHGLANRTPS